MADSQLRLLHLATLLPTYPKSKTRDQLRESLYRNYGHVVGVRTLQRDLRTLLDDAYLCVMQTDPTGKGREGLGYCYGKTASTIGPKMEPSTALTLVMASEYASKLMPEEVSEAMRPYVRQAENTLNASGKKYGGWKEKVRSVPRYLCFLKPDVDEQIYHAATTALLNEKCLVITYKERTKPYQLHPLALVDRGLETILVAYVEEYREHRQFMLHRINTAITTTTSFKRPAEFEVDKLIEEGYFSVPLDNDNYEPMTLKLRLFVRPDGAEPWLDIEGTPLSQDQVVQRSEDRRSATVSATVRDTQELRSWLLGQGAQLEVTEPAYLRQFMADSSAVLWDRYKNMPAS